MPDWGITTPGGSTFTGPAHRAMGGAMPATEGMTLDSVSIYMEDDGVDPRVAVYVGGDLDDPSGATLLEDFGQVSGNPTAGWVTVNSATNPTIPSGSVVWIAMKYLADTSIYSFTSSTDAGDFQTARGRADFGQGATDPTVAFAATLGGAANFGDFWYSWYLTYSVDAGGDTTTLEADPFTAGASFAAATFELVTQADPMAVTASFSDVAFSIDPGGFTLDAEPMSVSASFVDAALNYDGAGFAHTLTADPFAAAELFADATLRQVVTNSAQATRASVSISIGL